MSLHSSRRAHSYKWDELSIDDNAIERVESLAEDQGQYIMHNGMPNFEWAPSIEATCAWHDEQEEILTIAQEAPLLLEDCREN